MKIANITTCEAHSGLRYENSGEFKKNHIISLNGVKKKFQKTLILVFESIMQLLVDRLFIIFILLMTQVWDNFHSTPMVS